MAEVSKIFSIIEHADYWTIRNSVGSKDVAKTLLFNDKKTKNMSREDRIKDTLEARIKGDFGQESLPEQHSVIESVYDNRDNLQYQDRKSVV